MKLLIAHDGSRKADAVIADLPRMGLPAGSTVVVMSVADAWTAPGAGGETPIVPSMAAAAQGALKEAIARAAAAAESAATRVRATLPDLEVTAEHVAGSPGWEIVRKADEWKPDLVIVGATGTSRLERFVFGTTAHQVATEVRQSVRICRPQAGVSGPVRMVLGVDGSDASLVAARAIASRRWPTGSEVAIVAVVDAWLLTSLAGVASGRDAFRAEADAWIARAEEPLQQAGLATRRLVREGDPKAVLVKEARQFDADAIFVGARGRRGLERVLIGSVALAVSARAECSVEIVRG